jgi:Fe-S-cluster containining protein
MAFHPRVYILIQRSKIMIEKVKYGFTDVYLFWKFATESSKSVFGYSYPSSDVLPGSRTYACDAGRQHACNVYCCSNILPVKVNPLEISMISNATSLSPESFSRPSKSDAYINPRERIKKIQSPFEMSAKGSGYCVFNGMPKSKGCTEYQSRPLICRTFPLQFSRTQSGKEYVTQRKGCPGFSRGRKMTEEDLERVRDIGRVYGVLHRTSFIFKGNDMGNDYILDGKRILDDLGIEKSKVV